MCSGYSAKVEVLAAGHMRIHFRAATGNCLDHSKYSQPYLIKRYSQISDYPHSKVDTSIHNDYSSFLANSAVRDLNGDL